MGDLVTGVPFTADILRVYLRQDQVYQLKLKSDRPGAVASFAKL